MHDMNAHGTHGRHEPQAALIKNISAKVMVALLLSLPDAALYVQRHSRICARSPKVSAALGGVLPAGVSAWQRLFLSFCR